MATRREFIGQAAALSASLAATSLVAQERPVPRSALRILFLGGTGNIGPYHVRAAVVRGHDCAVFSRGITQADLPSGVERLIGDRNGNLEALEGRDWDAVIDLATFGPKWVRNLGEAIGSRTKHYTFVSTISVYGNPAANERTDESSPLLEYTGSADPYSIVTESDDYGALKVLCEREAAQHFAGRTLVLRPGFICGPDETHGVMSYWAARGRLGGEILAAGDPATPVQYVDVRDMAEWVVRLVEQGVTGTFNTVSPMLPLERVVGTAAEFARAPATVTWVTEDWLSRFPRFWGTLLFWRINEGVLTRIDSSRALANGLTIRPLVETLADTLTWYDALPEEMRRTLNVGFKRDPATGNFVQMRVPWSDYLDREKGVLAAWRERV
jgi:2'-hydroxyisoflavone reductase